MVIRPRVEVPLWHSELHVWCCRSCGTGCKCSMGSISGPGTSTPRGCSQKREREKERKTYLGPGIFLLLFSNSGMKNGSLIQKHAPSWKQLNCKMKKGKTTEDGGRVSGPLPVFETWFHPLSSCVAGVTLLNLSEPQFPPLQMGIMISTSWENVTDERQWENRNENKVA